MKYIHYYICLLLMMCSLAVCRADIVNDEVFHFVTKEDGLSGETVSRILPGYSWNIATRYLLGLQ